ncbi:MAG: hypothetical protein LBJ00_18755 [Planctomycetaceae bacterium]|jgi:hypothetical protein|nr:hypothetical protein [Planctomycetaceae bacterium]
MSVQIHRVFMVGLLRATVWFILVLLAVNFSGNVFAQMIPHTSQPYPGINPAARWAGMPGEPVVGYYQPVRINVPSGSQIAFAVNDRFVERRESYCLVGLLLGANYRLRVTDIKFHTGKELFPSVTVLQRTYPPKGNEIDYPIQIDLTHEDLELALSGRFVTRVIYLENPQSALPVSGDLGQQPSTEAQPNENPLQIAHSLGKPVAIIQLGGRVPSGGNQAPTYFFHGSPPWIALNGTSKN